MNDITCISCGQVNNSSSRFCSRCGTTLPEVQGSTGRTELTAGTKLRDRYIITHLLGQGGFGRTYLAQDTGRFNEAIALKEFIPAVTGTQALIKAEELFQREAATLHRLQHPQIPKLWELFQEEKRLFLVQDFIDGQTYQALLYQRQLTEQYFNESEIVTLLRQLLPVLGYLHQQGVIHRDISPDNIIQRNKDGLAVLIDLGGVKEVALQLSTSFNSPGGGTCLGKVGYAPDEQMRLGIVAPHSDLYALAVTTLVLMTGQTPQDMIDPQTMSWTWKQQLNLSPTLSNTLNRMLATRPSERFQTAEEVLQALDPRPTVIGSFNQVQTPKDFQEPPQIPPTSFENFSSPGIISNHENFPQKLRPALTSTRLFNHLLDLLFLSITWVFVTFAIFGLLDIMGYNIDDDNISSFGVLLGIGVNYFLYFFLEAFNGKTIAKYITRTKVVKNDGGKPSFMQIVGRTLARLIPLEVFSYLGNSNPVGLHDSLSGTIVVDDR